MNLQAASGERKRPVVLIHFPSMASSWEGNGGRSQPSEEGTGLSNNAAKGHAVPLCKSSLPLLSCFVYGGRLSLPLPLEQVSNLQPVRWIWPTTLNSPACNPPQIDPPDPDGPKKNNLQFSPF